MNTRDIEFFIRVYECKSMSAAAEQLYITPQGLSGVISKLEKELNCVLFNRDRGGTFPTECGEVFYRYALNIRHNLDDMTSEIDRITRLDKGIIRFGYSFGAMHDISLDIPMLFQKRYPDYKLECTELPDFVIEELIESGSLDVGFGSCSEPDKFNSIFISESRILFVPCRISRFYDSESVSVAEIAEEPITLRNDNFTTTKIMKKAFERCGKSPDIILNTGGIMRSVKMCRENRANTVILDSVAEQFGNNELKTIPFSEDLRWPMYMFTKNDVVPCKVLNSFIEFVKDTL